MAKDRYVGVVPPIVTPVDEFERVDEAALRGIVRRCKDVGLHGVFVAGSNGECMALTQAERNRAIRIVLDEAGPDYPVMSGVMDSSTQRVIDNIKALEDMGGDVAVVTPVFYARHATQDETVRHFEEILRHTKVKLMIYNIPMFTGLNLTPETIIRIAELDSRVIGCKDTSGNFPGFQKLLRHFKDSDFILHQGSTNLAAASMLLGADGFVPSLAPVGILPGIGQNAATMITYNQSKSVSKHPERFGHGSPEGICASETSNNAVNGGALIPLVTMGIPGDLTTSALLGGLTIHGLQAGPLLFTQNPDIIGTIMVAYALANFVMYIMELGLLKLFIRAIDVKFSFLFPAILMFCVMGVLALNNRMFDVWMMMLFGVVAYVLEQLGVDMTPIILGFILGPMIEKYFRSAMIASSGMFLDVFTRPISCVFMIVAVTFLLLPLFKMLRCRQKARKG